MTLALDASHDLHLGSRNGVAIARDGNAVAQGILTRLQLFRGEWYLNVDAGTPWYQKIFADDSDVRIVERELKDQILATPGVHSILSFSLQYNPSTRDASITFEVESVFGPSGILEVTL